MEGFFNRLPGGLIPMRSITKKCGRSSTGLRRQLFALILAGSCLLFSEVNLADEALLTSGQGYMLIRLNLNQGERVATLAMSNVDTDQIVRCRTKSFVPAGSNRWMALVAMPGGRYFWSEYESIYGSGVEAVRKLNQMHKRDAPGSAGDSFEIVPGVVNYVGDWNMRIVPSQRAQLDPIIEYDKSTLERYLADYPEHATRYEIYLSIMGKKAISLQELADIAEE
jgi:hypothetical protein